MSVFREPEPHALDGGDRNELWRCLREDLQKFVKGPPIASDGRLQCTFRGKMGTLMRIADFSTRVEGNWRLGETPEDLSQGVDVAVQKCGR